jgi:hypothetical protein
VLEVADAALALATGQHFSIRELQEMEEMRKLEAEAHMARTTMLATPAE